VIPLLITATGTGVGKTTVTAAIAALVASRGERVAVVKPAQTGIADGAPGDLDEVVRRAPGTLAVELARYPDPLSPAAAAARSHRWPVSLSACVRLLADLLPTSDMILVEGAGGLLVPFDEHGFTMRELAAELNLPVLVVVRPGLGTLNETALTLEALSSKELVLRGLVIGAWPADPGLAERNNIADLEHMSGRPLAGALPAGIADADDDAFYAAARAGLDFSFGGTFNPDTFRASYTRA
jgi:dethiobiotin synthase